MKIKMNRKDTYLLEDILLDVYNGLNMDSFEGSVKLEKILVTIQDAVYEDDIDEDL